MSDKFEEKGKWFAGNGSVIIDHHCFFAELKDDGSWDIHEKLYADDFRFSFNTTNLKEAIKTASKWT